MINLNSVWFDYFYYVFFIIMFLNFVGFVFCVKWYMYKVFVMEELVIKFVIGKFLLFVDLDVCNDK